MPNNSLTSISLDKAIIQYLFWDTVTRKIEVIHYINVEVNRNARLRQITQYLYDLKDQDYLDKCHEYNVDVKDKATVTEFIYDEFEETRNYPLALKFPVSGNYYPLAGLPHVVAVKLNKTTQGEVSKTSGEALP
jgi:hypothetical protein